MYEAYKDSGVMWLGRIPAHWKIARIKQKCCLIGSGTTPNSNQSSYYDGTINWIQSGDLYQKDIINLTEKSITEEALQDYSALHLYKPPFIVVAMYGASIGNVAISNIAACVNQACCVLVPNKDVSMSYMFYWLKYYKEIFIAHSAGGCQQNISQRKIKNGVIPVPPLHEQLTIAHYLDRITSFLDRMIATRRNELAAFIEFRKAIISQEVSRGDWPQVKLRHILRPVSVKNHPELPLLSVTREKGVIIRDIEDFETNRNFIPDDLSGYKVVRPGQLVINKMKAWQGSCGISDYTGIVSPAYFVFDVNFDNLRFFHHAIRSSIYADFFAQASGGIRVGQWDLQIDKIKDIPFPCPPAHEQHRIANFLDNICSHINNIITIYTQQIPLLHELKASIINNAVTGQIDLRNIHIP